MNMSIKNESRNGIDLNLNMDDSETSGMIEKDLESKIEKVCDCPIKEYKHNEKKKYTRPTSETNVSRIH